MAERIHHAPQPDAPVHLSQVPDDVKWTADTISLDTAMLQVPDAALAELAQIAADIKNKPRDILSLIPDDFDLAATKTFAARAKNVLDHETGVVVIDRLPLDLYDTETAKAVYWLFASLLGRPVEQNVAGRRLYDVRDSGKTHGNGVRGSVTNVELYFHTDNSASLVVPQYVGLLCLNPAKSGGESRLVNWASVFERLHAEHPDLVARAAQPFLFDRQMEHAPDAPKVMSKPVVRRDGESIGVSFSSRLMRTGYRMAGQDIDPQSAAFLDAVDDIVNRPEMQFRMNLQRGQVQLINNARIGHARTAFEDHADPERRRHLVRIWLREHGSIGFDG